MKMGARIDRLIFLIILPLLPLAYLLLKPCSAYTQDMGTVVGQFTVRWRLTIEGKDVESEYRQDSHGYPKYSEEINDDQIFITSGEVRGIKIDHKEISDEIVQEQSDISSSVAGQYKRVNTVDGYQLCWDTGKYGYTKCETIDEWTYDIDGSLAPDYPYLRLDSVDASSGSDNLNFYVTYMFKPLSDNEFQIKGTGQYTETHKDTCGHTKVESHPESYEGLNIAAFEALGDAFGDDNFQQQLEGELQHQSGNNYSVTRVAYYPYTKEESYGDHHWKRTGNIILEYTITYEDHPSNLEVVITPASDYEEWTPVGGANEKTKSNDIAVLAELRVNRYLVNKY